METTESSIRQILVEVSNCPPDADPNADLYLELGVASIHAMMLLTVIEERFEIQVPDDQFIEARSISQLIQLVDSLKQSHTHA